MGDENWISQCVPADPSVLSVPGLPGGMTDTTSDEFVHHLFAVVILSLHRLDVGDMMVDGPELLLCLEFGIKSMSENSSRILVLETMTSVVLSASSFLFPSPKGSEYQLTLV